MKSEIQRRTTSFTPADLAGWLERWAFRREKVLELLDITSAKSARRLASECRYLAYCDPRSRDSVWAADWYTLRLEVAAFLGDRREPAQLGA